MLKPYFAFYWLAFKEFLPDRRRKLLKLLWFILAFFAGWIVADVFGIALIRPLKWAYYLMPGSYWVSVGLLAVIAFQCVVIEGARRVYARTKWLQDLAKTDRQNIGAGVKITGCEVGIELFRELGRGWVEFRFKIFNGSVFPIALADIVGLVSFSNMSKVRQLDGEFKVLPNLSAGNCQRHNVGHFTLHHELSKEDVDFISAARDGCFIFDQLIITARGQGEAFDDLPATRLATGPDDVQPTLRGAFRHDASALEAIWKSHISRMNALNVVQGMYEKAHSQLQRTEATIPGWAAKDWELDTLMVLDRGYRDRALSEQIYKRIWQGHVVPETADEQERRLGHCIQRLVEIIEEEAENIKP